MKIKNLVLTSPNTINCELDVISSICILHGEHSALALDLVREIMGDYGAETDPDCYDDGRFVIHSNIEIDGKNYSVCYIRNADFMGDNRIAANFSPNSFNFSIDDTEEFVDKCNKLNRDTSNVISNYKVVSIAENDCRPLFVYCEDADDISQVIDYLATLGKQAFVSVNSLVVVPCGGNIQTIFVG